MIHIACPACGYSGDLPENEPQLRESLQCPMCGTWIRNYATEVLAASGPPPADDAGPDGKESVIGQLFVTGAPAPEGPHPVRGPKTVVGREEVDITIEDPTMSIRHFEIERRGGDLFIRDLGSTNGTKVNGEKIRATTLKSGDRIQAGLTCLVYRET